METTRHGTIKKTRHLNTFSPRTSATRTHFPHCLFAGKSAKYVRELLRRCDYISAAPERSAARFAPRSLGSICRDFTRRIRICCPEHSERGSPALRWRANDDIGEWRHTLQDVMNTTGRSVNVMQGSTGCGARAVARALGSCRRDGSLDSVSHGGALRTGKRWRPAMNALLMIQSRKSSIEFSCFPSQEWYAEMSCEWWCSIAPELHSHAR